MVNKSRNMTALFLLHEQKCRHIYRNDEEI